MYFWKFSLYNIIFFNFRLINVSCSLFIATSCEKSDIFVANSAIDIPSTYVLKDKESSND